MRSTVITGDECSGAFWTGPEGRSRQAEVARSFYAWLSSGQSGCRFAQVLAARVSSQPWATSVVEDTLNTQQLGKELNDHLETLAKEAELAIILAPEIRDSRELVMLVRRLLSHESWKLEIIDGSNSETVHIGLRWRLTSDIASWVVGFADFPTMPLTRRASVMAMAIRTRMPERIDQPAAYVADVPHGIAAPEQFERLWNDSVSARMRLNPEEFLEGARARVTFSVSWKDWYSCRI
jgi:hypothetical protein